MTINERNTIKFTEARNGEILRILSNFLDDGRKGRAFELSCARLSSHKVSVSAQGKIDVHVKFIKDGKAKYIPAECKTNGGRITDLLDGSNKSKFVIYRLDTVQKHKATKKQDAYEEKRFVPALIIPTALFLDMLRDCNAIKTVAHGGVVDGMAIQPTSKKMYERLNKYAENYPDMKFDNDAAYEDWMFEGLEL